ncbi:MAG TPA: class I SAM-dependent methyltransferase, partial [Baekduia sp.]|nr:class I SAM-dependent methyltransferase [Baekduia sp.]
AKNQCATAFGGLYGFYIERPRLARAISRCVWGAEVAHMYASMDVIGRQTDGSTIVDVPCGGGLALRALRPAQEVRYVAIDIAPDMLARTRSKAAARGLRPVETVEADMRRPPLPEASADLLVTYSGLHMINDPETAISEFRPRAQAGRPV